MEIWHAYQSGQTSLLSYCRIISLASSIFCLIASCCAAEHDIPLAAIHPLFFIPSGGKRPLVMPHAKKTCQFKEEENIKVVDLLHLILNDAEHRNKVLKNLLKEKKEAFEELQKTHQRIQKELDATKNNSKALAEKVTLLERTMTSTANSLTMRQKQIIQPLAITLGAMSLLSGVLFLIVYSTNHRSRTS